MKADTGPSAMPPARSGPAARGGWERRVRGVLAAAAGAWVALRFEQGRNESVSLLAGPLGVAVAAVVYAAPVWLRRLRRERRRFAPAALQPPAGQRPPLTAAEARELVLELLQTRGPLDSTQFMLHALQGRRAYEEPVLTQAILQLQLEQRIELRHHAYRLTTRDQ